MSPTGNLHTAKLIYWHAGAECCDAKWEAAYAAFETPDQEVAKFLRRFHQLGVHRWDRALQIADLFCGRGNGLFALELLGFHNLKGVDLAPSLLQQYRGSAQMYVADCRELRFEDESLDAVMTQGGLHHLPDVEQDLPLVLDEIRRVLRPGGVILIVEPWLTPFLRLVHFLARRKLVRCISPKFRAFQGMTEREQVTYDAWLNRPEIILEMLQSRFVVDKLEIRLGKLMFGGQKAPTH